MEDERETTETIASTVITFLTCAAPLSGGGWEVEEGLPDEVEIITPEGQKFRLTVEEVTNE